jgi:hypothetical protein
MDRHGNSASRAESALNAMGVVLELGGAWEESVAAVDASNAIARVGRVLLFDMMNREGDWIA